MTWDWTQVSRTIGELYPLGIPINIKIILPCQQDIEYTDYIPCSEVRTSKKLSWVWHYTASAGEAPVLELRELKYPFIAITPRSTLTWSSSSW